MFIFWILNYFLPWNKQKSNSRTFLITWGSTDKVNSSAAGDIDDSEVFEEAVVAPDPSGRHAVDDGVDEREEAICVKVTSENDQQTFLATKPNPYTK